jgi:hypothetical protein
VQCSIQSFCSRVRLSNPRCHYSRRAYRAICNIPVDIPKDELDRRIRLFGGNRFGICPTINLHGIEFRAVPPPGHTVGLSMIRESGKETGFPRGQTRSVWPEIMFKQTDQIMIQSRAGSRLTWL